MAGEMVHRIIDKMDMKNFIVGSTHMVEVTHINDPKSFFIRLDSLFDDVQLLERRGTPIDDNDIKIGKRVIYRSKLLKKYVRGDIEFICFKETSASCTVLAVDYGCREKHVHSKHIYLPDLDIDCPPLAIHCQLHLCEPKEDVFEDEVLDAMKFFVGKDTAKMSIIHKDSDRFIVELKTLECPDDVATMLGLLHFTTFTSSDNAVNRFADTSSCSDIITYKYKSLEVGQKMCVRVQSGDSISSFYVADINDFEKITSSSNSFSEYCEIQQLQNIVAAKMDRRCCGVKVGQPPQYERAFVKEMTAPGKALVKLIDWGTEIEVDCGDIKCANSAAYTELPGIAIYCSSNDDQIWDNGLDKFLYPGYAFIIQVVELGNGVDEPHKVNIMPILGNELDSA